MTDDIESSFPSPLLRALGTLAAGFIAVYGTIGVLRNDLRVSLGKSSQIVHLHGFLALLCYGGMIMMSVGAFRLLYPGSKDAKLDFFERRARHGLPMVLGLVIYAGAQLFAD